VRVALLGLAIFAGCMGPFHPRYIDNRDPDRVRIAQVHDDGRVALSDGRAVTLRGVQWPSDERQRAHALQVLRSYVGEEVSVRNPAGDGAAELWVWAPMARCGTCEATWDPFPGEAPAYYTHNLARYLLPQPICGTSDIDSAQR
jgi:hypothetical protein